MDIDIKSIDDEQVWDSFLAKSKPNTFLQSRAWGELQAKHGEGIRYLGIYNNNQLIGVALILTVNAKRGRHLFIPHGPIIKSSPSSEGELEGVVIRALVKHLKQIAKQDKAVALRISPLLLNTPANQQLFKSLGFRPAPLHVHAERTWNLDLSPNEEEILSNMRKTTRHAIKKAETAGIVAKTAAGNTLGVNEKTPSVEEAAINRFWNLYSATQQRHQFTPFSKQFLQDQLDIFGDQAFMVIASHNHHDLAAGIFIHMNNTVFYHHGASAQLNSKLPASQLLQWAAIKEAKHRGAKRYNFWGIAPKNKPDHPFAGITTFKQGFGGYEEDYLHAQDLPLSLGYAKLWAIESYRKHKRGF